MKTRTMVYLEREELKALKARARTERISLAELMRRLIKKHLNEGPALPPVPPEAYSKIVAVGASGQRDIAEHHDAYLGEALRRDHAR